MSALRLAIAAGLASVLSNAPPPPARAAAPVDPTSVIWVATSEGTVGLDAGDGTPSLELPDTTHVRHLAADPTRGVIWTYSCPGPADEGRRGRGARGVDPADRRGRQRHDLRAFDMEGAQVLAMSVPSPAPSGETHGALRVDPADGSVWLALGTHVHHASAAGEWLASRRLPLPVVGAAMDSARRLLWVATNERLVAFDRAADEVRAIDFAQATALAVDDESGDLWIARADAVRRLSPDGQELASTSLAGVVDLDDDGQGGAWAFTPQRLVRIGADGEILHAANEHASAMVADSSDGSAWVALHRDVQHLSAGGASLLDVAVSGQVRDLELPGPVGGGPQVNRPPVLTPVADRTLGLGESLRLRFSADDPDEGDTLSFELLASPAGAVLDPPGSPLFLFTPGDAQVGTHEITVRVSDAAGLASEDSFQVTVLHANRPPVLAAQADEEVAAGTHFSRVLVATDPDPGDVLTFALLSGPAGMALLGGDQLHWAPGASEAGEHAVTVSVTDGDGAVDAARFVLAVGLPTSRPLARDDAYDVLPGQTLTLAAPGVLENDVDPAGRALTAVQLTSPDKGTLSAFGTDGSFTFTAPAGLEAPPVLDVRTKWTSVPGSFTAAGPWFADFDRDGSMEVVLFDGGTIDSQLYAIKSDGSWLFAFSGYLPDAPDCHFNSAGPMAVADVDDDGGAELILGVNCARDQEFPYWLWQHNRVAALAYDPAAGDLRLKWLSPSVTRQVARQDGTLYSPLTGQTLNVPFTVARLAPGEPPSILFGKTYANGQGGELVQGATDQLSRVVTVVSGTDGSITRRFYHAPAAQGGLCHWLGGNMSWHPMTIVADLDGDGPVEVILGGTVWNLDGTVRLELDATPDNPYTTDTALADLDGDGEVEILARYDHTANNCPPGRLRAWRRDGTLLWVRPLPGTYFPSRMTVADLDRDGRSDILIGRDCDVVAYDHEGRMKWRRSLPPEHFGCTVAGTDKITSLSVYDLNGDGVREVIVQDGNNDILFLRGDTGQTQTFYRFPGYLREALHQSTMWPSVVDLDGDGHAEIVFNRQTWGGDPKLVVIEGDTQPWRAAPRSYNGWWTGHYLEDDHHVPETPPRWWTDPLTNVWQSPRQLPYAADPRERQQAVFTYAAEAGGLASEPAQVVLDLEPSNNPPVITSTPPDTFDCWADPWGFEYQLAAVDPDPGDTVTFRLAYTACGGPGTTNVTPSGLMTFTDYLWMDEFCEFMVEAVDSFGGVGRQNLTVYCAGSSLAAPDVVGLDRTVAEGVLGAMEFQLRPVVEVSDPAPAGQVIAQEPEAGVMTLGGTAFRLTVSKGPEPRTMPSVVGRDLSSAASILAASGFSVGDLTHAYSDVAPRGEVMDQDPAAGLEQVPGPVALTVSLGTGLDVRLSREVVAAGSLVTLTVEAVGTDGTPEPPPPVSVALSPVGDFAGDAPNVSGDDIAVPETTRGAFDVTVTEVGGSGRVATARFAVLNADAHAEPTQQSLYVHVAEALQDAQGLLPQLDAARTSGDEDAMREALGQLVALWQATVDVDQLSRSTPLSPSAGFLPPLADLPPAGLPPTVDDLLVVPALDDVAEALAAMRETLDQDEIDFDAFRSQQADLAVKVEAFARLEPSPYGVLDARTRYSAILSQRLPEVMDLWLEAVQAELNGNVRTNGVSLGQPTSGPSLPTSGSPRAQSFSLPISMEEVSDASSIHVLLVKKLYMPAIKHLAYSMGAIAVRDLLRSYFNTGQLSGVVTGSSLSFHVFEAPYSTIEVLGVDYHHPESTSVLIIGPTAIGAVQGLQTKIEALIRQVGNSGLDRPRNLDEIRNSVEDIHGSLQAAIDQGFETYKTFDRANFQADLGYRGCLADLDPTCNSLVYKAGFKAVHACGTNELCLPAPVLVITWNEIEGGVGIETFNFLPKRVP